MTSEILEFTSNTDKNGNTLHLRIDVASRKFNRDFVSFCGKPIKVTKTAMSQMVESLKWFGWEEKQF